jgi:hypothetical protein
LTPSHHWIKKKPRQAKAWRGFFLILLLALAGNRNRGTRGGAGNSPRMRGACGAVLRLQAQGLSDSSDRKTAGGGFFALHHLIPYGSLSKSQVDSRYSLIFVSLYLAYNSVNSIVWKSQAVRQLRKIAEKAKRNERTY